MFRISFQSLIRCITNLEKLQQAVAASAREVERAGDVRRTEDAHHRETAQRLSEAETSLDACLEKLDADVDAWIGSLSVLALSETQGGAILDAPAEERPALVRSAAVPVGAELQARVTRLSVQHQEQARELEEAQAGHRKLSEAPHPEPVSPTWRTADRAGRAGAPLYLLCDFAEDVSAETQLGVEGALEAAGLLDAWVTPTGEVLGADAFDVLLAAHGTPAEGQTLADVLKPTPVGRVPADVVRAVLAQVAVVASGHGPKAGAWVGLDGRFGLGPLRGAYRKERLEYVGATAREEARQRRLAELAAEIARLEELLAQTARTCGRSK